MAKSSNYPLLPSSASLWDQLRSKASDYLAPVTDEEIAARLRDLAERVRRRTRAIKEVLSRPGAETLTDEQAAALSGHGATAECVYRLRHLLPPPPMSPEEEEGWDRLRQVVERVQRQTVIEGRASTNGKE